MSNEFVYQLVSDVVGVMVINRVEKKDGITLDMKFFADAGLYVGASTLNEMFVRMWMVQYVYSKLPENMKSAGMAIGDLISISAIKMILNKYVLGRVQSLSLKELMQEVLINLSILSVSMQAKMLMEAGAPQPPPAEQSASDNNGLSV